MRCTTAIDVLCNVQGHVLHGGTTWMLKDWTLNVIDDRFWTTYDTLLLRHAWFPSDETIGPLAGGLKQHFLSREYPYLR